MRRDSAFHSFTSSGGEWEEESISLIVFSLTKAAHPSREREKILEQTNDGFLISEKDLELRGPGDFFGTRQHGIPELKIANLYKDIEILKKAQEAALEIISSDPLMEREENVLLGKSVREKFNASLQSLCMN